MTKEKFSILILSTSNSEKLLNEVTKANAAAGTDTEITATVINPLDIMLKIQQNDISLKAYRQFNPEGAEISFNQLQDLIPQFDAVIPMLDDDRAGHYGRDVVRHFQLQNVYSTASAYGLEMCLNEFKGSQFIVKDRTEKDMPISSKLLMNGPSDLRQTIDLAGGYPLRCTILKQGKKLADTLIENDQQAICLLQSVNDLESEIILSPFVLSGHDKTVLIHAIVFDGYKPNSEIFAYSVTVPFDFKNKNSLDGITSPVELDSREKMIVARAARLSGLDFAEITLVRDLNGLGSTINSISGKPNIEAAEAATGENISAALINHVIENIRHQRKNPIWDISNVRGFEPENGNPNSGKFLTGIIRSLCRIEKNIRLSAYLQNRSLTPSEDSAISIVGELLESFKK